MKNGAAHEKANTEMTMMTGDIDNGNLNELAAAIHLGIFPELLRWFTENCPKSGENNVLPFKNVGGFYSYSKADLDAYEKYLWEKWPSPDAASRAHIPDQIKAEIRRSAQYRCSICTHEHNLEIAHIKSWADTKCNHPHNLLLLCPNHHTQYDYGYKPHAALKKEDINFIKREQVQTRRYEWQSKLEPSIASLRLVNRLEKMAKALDSVDEDNRESMQTLAANLITNSEETPPPKTTSKRLDDAIKDASAFISDKSKQLKTTGNNPEAVQKAMKDASQVLEQFEDVFDSLDDEPCPHCDGRGQTGLVGDICKNCNGAGAVTSEELNDYDADAFDEEPCPHCGGKGTIGFRGEICKYCGGSQVVTHQEANEYVFEKVGEVLCPHCDGKGLTGLHGDICIYCNGNCLISPEEEAEYDPDKLDEVPCPHCDGRGLRGFSGDSCKLCNGSQTVSRKENKAYYKKYGDRF